MKQKLLILRASALIFVLLTLIFASCGASDGKETLEVYFFNVGQGDAALAVLGDCAILFDAGTDESEEKLAAYLDRLGIKRLEYVVLSHPHDDHIGGADKVLDRYEVGRVIMPETDSTERCVTELFAALDESSAELIAAAAGDEYSIGALTLEVLSPREYTGDANLDSATVKLTYGDTSFLFTGDLEGEAEASLVESAGEKLHADVLKVGHHGSASATSEAFLNAVAPSVAVISCGENNDYGHPHSSVTERLYAYGITVGRTDRGSSIVVISDGKTAWIKE